MGYAENLGSYWRGRYKVSPGKYATVRDADGEAIRFRTKASAKRAADAEEAKLLAGTKKMAAAQITFGTYASRWYAALDLAASTMQNYRRHIEEHLLPAFENFALADIQQTQIAAWEKRERAVPYAPSSVKTWRATLHLILADALDEGLIDSNPATKRRGRGKRAGRSRNRAPEKAVTTPLGILLLAERTALLSARDDEFVAIALMGYTGMRWGEIVGLETEFVRPKSVRVEWQLYELDTGELHRCPPKDDSYRDIDTPGFLATLLARHIARTTPMPCECHGLAYVFRGHGTANGAASRPGAKLVDVARRCRCFGWHRLECPQPSGCRGEADPAEGAGGHRRTRLRPQRRVGGAVGTLAALRLRHLVVPSSRHGLVLQARPAGSAPGTPGCRAVARDSGARARSLPSRRDVLAADRTRAVTARAAPHSQDPDAGSGHPAEAYGRSHGS